MVYPGHPSTGCLQCIKRKVKCDEEKPACRRCQNRGEQCPGYQRPRYRFVASGSKGNRKGRKSSSFEESSNTATSSSIISFDPKISASPSRNMSLEPLHWYFRSYIISVMHAGEAPEAEWFAFLPKMYDESPDNTHLRLSVEAVSLAAFSNYFKADHLIADARKAYGTALASLNSALKDPKEAKEDQTLTAVLMLLMFETLTAAERPLENHINGLLLMLQLRGEEQFQTMRGRVLFRLVQFHLQARPLMQKCQNSISPEEYDINAHAMRVLPSLSNENSRVTARCVLTFRINQLCVKAASLIHRLEHVNQRQIELERLLQEADLLDAKMERWIATFPTDLHPREARNTEDGSRVLIYPHHMIPVAYNMYRCGRIMLQEMRMRCGMCLLKEYWGECKNSDERGKVITLIQGLARDLCDSIPYSLHEISEGGKVIAPDSGQGRLASAYHLLWPLLVVKLATYTTPEQKDTASRTLERIGNEMGIKQALRLNQDRTDLFET